MSETSITSVCPVLFCWRSWEKWAHTAAVWCYITSCVDASSVMYPEDGPPADLNNDVRSLFLAFWVRIWSCCSDRLITVQSNASRSLTQWNPINQLIGIIFVGENASADRKIFWCTDHHPCMGSPWQQKQIYVVNEEAENNWMSLCELVAVNQCEISVRLLTFKTPLDLQHLRALSLLSPLSAVAQEQ